MTHRTALTPAMAKLRNQGDELADAVVAELFESGQVHHVNTALRLYEKVGQRLPDELPDSVHEYFQATALVPDWVDWGVMEQARTFFIDNCAQISTGLALAAMPACYAVVHMAELLHASHRLDYPSRRMAETGQFTVFLLQPDAFEEGSRFIPAVQKVRLLHASIRHHLLREGHWDRCERGMPISQMDMIGGQMIFSLHVLDALVRLGVDVSESGAQAYYYAWRVVGAMLGCDQAAAPVDLAAGREFFDRCMIEYLGPSEAGAALTRELVEMYDSVIPGAKRDPIVPALIRYLVGPTVADWLEVPQSPLWESAVRVTPAIVGAMSRIEESGPIGEWLVSRTGQLVTKMELASLTHGRIMQYTIPDHLKADFGVASSRQRWSPPPLTAL
jgi:hypothetical protein